MLPLLIAALLGDATSLIAAGDKALASRDLRSALHYWRRGELSARGWIESLRGPKIDAVFSWREKDFAAAYADKAARVGIRGQDLLERRAVAIKLIRFSADHPDGPRRFNREIQICSKLSHPRMS